MPDGAGAQRADEMAAIENVLHARRIDPKVRDWLAAIDASTLSPTDAAQLREIKRARARADKVPVELSTAIARATSAAQRRRAEARAADDVAAFKPVLA